MNSAEELLKTDPSFAGDWTLSYAAQQIVGRDTIGAVAPRHRRRHRPGRHPLERTRTLTMPAVTTRAAAARLKK